MNKKQKKTLVRIIISAALLVCFNLFLPVDGLSRLFFYLIPYFIIGYDVLIKAGKGIKNRQPMDECFLMAVATVGAIALAVYENGDYTEGISVMLFYQIGEFFQSAAVGASRRNITELMDIRPDYANVKRDGVVEKVDPDEVEVGETIVVNPGEKVPIDGKIISGHSTMDTAALTGESLPVDVSAGAEVLSGSINLSGVLEIETTKEFDESTASKILDLVESASSRKSRSEKFITKFARIYTPVVVYSAIALAILPPLIRLLMGMSPAWGSFIYRALTFLVISCPCALVISIPLSFFAGLGGASHAGVLIKGSNFMEILADTKTIAFDKTGTLTKGVFAVTGIHHSTLEDAVLLRYAALVEQASSHPIGKSLQKAYGEALEKAGIAKREESATDIQEIAGRGITGLVDGKKIAVGNSRLMIDVGADYKDCHEPGTIIHVAIDGTYAGHIVISDVVKPTSAKALKKLKSMGIAKTVMLTGDRKETADYMARIVGVDEVKADLLPQDKVMAVETLLAQKNNEKDVLAFVGDGINDAPVLARADIGIGMGGAGSDAAIEAADIVLMDDDPMKIPLAIGISKKCMRIVKENIVFSIGVKLLVLVLGALGLANMWAAVFADVGVMILAVLNSIRCLRVKKLS